MIPLHSNFSHLKSLYNEQPEGSTAVAVAVAVAVDLPPVDGSISPIFALLAAKIASFFLSAISLLTLSAAFRVSPHIS